MLVRIFSYLVLCTIVIAIYGLFYIKDKVTSLNYQLSTISKQINYEKDTIHILKAEQSYLTSPARLKRLTENYLELNIIKTAQMVRDPLAPDDHNYVKTEDVSTHAIGSNVKWRYKKITNNKYIQTISSRN